MRKGLGMDGEQFDSLAKVLGAATTRRQVLRRLVGIAAGGVANLFTLEDHADAAPVELHLPFPVGETWYFTGGPHPNVGGTVRSAVDFAVPELLCCPNHDCKPCSLPPTTASSHVAVAAAAGKVITVESTIIEVLHAGGLITGYGHLTNAQVKVNDCVAAGQALGHPSCLTAPKDITCGVHVHFYFKQQGVGDIPADGQVLSGWTIHAGAENYVGTMSDGATTISQDGSGARSGTGLTSDNTLGTVGPDCGQPSQCSPSQQRCDNGSCIVNCSHGQIFDKAHCQCVCPDKTQFCPSQNRCVPVCQPGQVLNPQNCNCGCAQPCPSNQKQAKDCTCSCQGNSVLCPGADTCIDLNTNASNCHTCGHSCNGGTCQGGTCRCEAPLILCGGTCVDPSSDGANCGACGHICSQADGEICCGGQCVNSLTDASHCGNCQTTCPAGDICDQGKGCCPQGQAICGSGCVPTSSFDTDSQNCGSCGHICAQGTVCVNRECASATTGTLIIHAVDAATQAPVTDGLYHLSDTTQATVFGDYFDGLVAPPGANPGTIADGQADGMITVANLAPGDYLLRLMGFFPNNGNTRDTHVDTIATHPVTITAGSSTPLDLSFPSPGGSIQTRWVDSGGNPLSAAFLAAIGARNTLRTVGDTWAYFGSQIDTGPTNIYDFYHDLLGPGPYSLDSYYFRNGQETVWIAQNQAVTVTLGQTTVVDVVVADYCQVNRPCSSDAECCAERAEVCVSGVCSSGQPPLQAATPVG